MRAGIATPFLSTDEDIARAHDIVVFSCIAGTPALKPQTEKLLRAA